MSGFVSLFFNLSLNYKYVWVCDCEQVLRQVCSSLRCANICSPPASSCPVSIFPASAVHPRSSTENLMKCCKGKEESNAVTTQIVRWRKQTSNSSDCARLMWLVWESCTQHGKPSDGAQKKQITEKNTTTPWPESILKLTNDHGGKGVESQELADYRELSVHSGEHHRLSTFFSFLQTLSCYSSYSSFSPLIFLERVPCPPFLTIYPLYSL